MKEIKETQSQLRVKEKEISSINNEIASLKLKFDFIRTNLLDRVKAFQDVYEDLNFTKNKLKREAEGRRLEKQNVHNDTQSDERKLKVILQQLEDKVSLRKENISKLENELSTLSYK